MELRGVVSRRSFFKAYRVASARECSFANDVVEGQCRLMRRCRLMQQDIGGGQNERQDVEYYALVTRNAFNEPYRV